MKTLKELFKEYDENNKKTLRETFSEMDRKDIRANREIFKDMENIGRTVKKIFENMAEKKKQLSLKLHLKSKIKGAVIFYFFLFPNNFFATYNCFSV